MSELQLATFDIRKQYYDYQCYYWQIPKTDIQVPVVIFQPIKSNKVASYREYLFIRFIAHRASTALDYSHSLLLDLRKLRMDAPPTFELTPERIKWLNEPFQLLIDAGDYTALQPVHSDDEMNTDDSKAFLNIARAFADKRKDGKSTFLQNEVQSSLQLHPLSIDVSSIRVEAATWEIPGNEKKKGGYISFNGEYRSGSNGSDDAMHIRWHLDYICDCLQPDALMVDLQGLQYEWGDDISLYPHQFDQRGAPICFILFEKQRVNFKNEIYPNNIEASVEEAYKKLREKF
jgi:hypothetical protein